MAPARIGSEPPASLLAELRTILPTVELLNVDGHRTWWMMDYVPNEPRQTRYARQQQAEYDRLKDGRPVRTHVLATLAWGAAGYVLIGRYEAVNGQLPQAQMIAELHQKQRASALALEAAFRASERASTHQPAADAQRAQWHDYIDAEGPAIWRHARGRVVVTRPDGGT